MLLQIWEKELYNYVMKKLTASKTFSQKDLKKKTKKTLMFKPREQEDRISYAR